MVNKKSAPTDRQGEDDATTQARAVDEALQKALDEVAEGQSGRDPASDDGLEAARDNLPDDEAVEQLQRALQEANKRTLMAQAELENFRKRTRREQSEQLKFSVIPLVRDLLPVIDNFERALGAVSSDQTQAGMVEGIGMVHKLLMDVLEQHGVQEISALGVAFDPMQHEAVGQMPSDEVPAGGVLKVMQPGYRLHDRVIRPSQVIVSQGE